MTIESIHIKNVFKHKDTFISFKNGINYLVGPNESGKTVILEMISYSLFGSSVLRSEVSDYKNTEVSMIFTINKVKYLVERNKKVNLYTYNEDGTKELIVTGMTPVNKHITELLGYDSSVFFKTNYSSQLEGHSHAIAKKSERISLINKINGIEEATKLEKYLESQKRSYSSEVKGMGSSLSLNTIQWVSNPYLDCLSEKDSDEYKQTVNKLLNQVSSLQQQLSALEMIPTLSEYELNCIKNASETSYFNVYEQKEYKGIQSYHDSLKSHYQAYIAHTELCDNYKNYIKEHSVYLDNGDLVTPDVVLELENKLEANKNYEEKQKLLSQGHINCPNCNTSFPLSIESISKIENGNIFYDIPSRLKISSYRRFIDNHYSTVISYKDKLDNMEEISFEMDHFRDICVKYQSYCNLISKQQQFKELSEKYNSYYDDTSKDRLISTISVLLEQISKYKDKYEKLDKYLTEKQLFESTNSIKEQVKSKIDSLVTKMGNINTVINKSKSIRLAIQNSCIPSLNKKASTIINKMTGSQHYSLCVSDTFELLLDKNLLSKYSGSTQVISSVAFRIALMDLFYKKTFPVFIGDEVDSFTDEDRATFVRDAFNVLAKDGYQLILISHFKQEDLTGNIININECKKD